MKPRNLCESEYDFVLVLSGVPGLSRRVEDALYKAGCDDATLSFRSGSAVLSFSRTAPSLEDAILSAIQDVHKANVGASVLRVNTCDLVTQADIARRIGRQRQVVQQYITGERGPGRFPAPVCQLTEGHPLWRWCEVAYWLWQHNLIKEDVLRQAEAVAIINNALELRRQQQMYPELTQEILDSLG